MGDVIEVDDENFFRKTTAYKKPVTRCHDMENIRQQWEIHFDRHDNQKKFICASLLKRARKIISTIDDIDILIIELRDTHHLDYQLVEKLALDFHTRGLFLLQIKKQVPNLKLKALNKCLPGLVSTNLRELAYACNE